MNLRGRDFVKLLDYTPEEIRYLIDLAKEFKRMKKEGIEHKYLSGKNIAILFEKDSTRTRCAFEVAGADLGMGVTYLGPTGSQMGKKESIADTARVLSRMYDGIEYRGFSQQIVEDLAKYSCVPVWNGLTDEFHPTQMLADIMTCEECLGDMKGKTLVFCGDARNNVANSLMVVCSKLGINFTCCAPKKLWPEDKLVRKCRSIANKNGSKICMTEDIMEGTKGAHVLYTDVWVSMGEPEEKWAERIKLLKPYQVTMDVMKNASKDAIFLHCLPSFHDVNTTIGKEIYEKYGISEMEVTNEVFESNKSKVFDEAENRMHTIKAVMYATMGGNKMRIVVALGGNALGKTPEEQLELVKETAKQIVKIVSDGHEVVVVHGNGPQVGMINLAFDNSYQNDAGTPLMPFAECGAMSQGYIGYHLQQAITDELNERNIDKECVTIITQVEVDPKDKAFENPTKPVGMFYTKEQAEEIEKEKGYTFVEDAGRGYRRVVPSPKPVDIVEQDVIRDLVSDGNIVITCGGGGIPVRVDRKDGYEGVDAVIDKDFAACKLAKVIDADVLLILTAVSKVCIRYNTPEEKVLDELTLDEAYEYIENGEFAKGSMLPKVEACVDFVKGTNNGVAIISALKDGLKALNGKTGTRIVK